MDSYCFQHYVKMLEIIWDYMKTDWNFTLHRNLQKGNVCVNVLTKLEANGMDTLVMVHELPPCFSPALLVDAIVVSGVQNIPANRKLQTETTEIENCKKSCLVRMCSGQFYLTVWYKLIFEFCFAIWIKSHP